MDTDFTGTDRFVIERHLGAGSMGSVYLALDKQLGSRVALKVLLSVDAAGIYRFKQEFRALADVTHPNLVTLHELFSQAEHWFFTMEYVQGKDLLSYLHGGRMRTFASTPRPISQSQSPSLEFPSAPEPYDQKVKGLELLFPSPLVSEERLRSSFSQIVEGLLAVHAAGKLHRDLKPENVLVTEQGRVVLLDFGIALEKQKDLHQTLSNVMGTPEYMAPEQCRDEQLTEAADWYALGVMLYEVLTGDVPVSGSPIQIVTIKQEWVPTPPSDVVSEVPEDLDRLCLQLLQRDPAERPTGEAILRALRDKRAASVPAPETLSASVPDRSELLVGRSAQLQELQAALAATENGDPVVVLMHGAPGIGKTTLIDRFAQRVQERAIVLRGRCYERESVPFKAFDNVIDTISRYLRRLPAVDSARMLPRDVDVLAELFPVLKRVEVVRRNRRMRALPAEPHELRQRAFRALKELFSRMADVEPLVVCIDDLQWSDLDSAKLLGELISGQERPAFMLVCMYRSADTEHSAGLRALLAKIDEMSELQVRKIAIGALSPEDSLELASALLGSETADEGARKVGYESGGNPQVLTQLVRHVQERRASGKASPDTARGLISFERVIEQRLSSLSTDGRTLLELLSVAGRPVPEPMLTLVASFNIDLSTALAELRGKKLVRGVATRDARAVEIFHDTIREAVTHAMSPEALSAWHRRLAAALEASGAFDLEALTFHLLGAGERNRASLYACRAAVEAETCMAFDMAARLYGLAAEHCPDAEERRELLTRFANALLLAGRGVAAANAYVEAAQGASASDANVLRARAGVQFLLAGDEQKGLQLLAQPLAAAGVALPQTFEQTLTQARYLWQELRSRGLSFHERSAHDISQADRERLELLWGVCRGLSLHEVDRPLALVSRYALEALNVGEPLHIVRSLLAFHGQVDAAFSGGQKRELSGALDVAEALIRRFDQPEARALLALTKGTHAAYSLGKIELGLHELGIAEDLFRNQCRGAAYELRRCRMIMAHTSFVVWRTADAELLKGWVTEAEEGGDPISASRLRMALAVALLASDNAEGALALLDAGRRAQGTLADRSPITRAVEMMAYAGTHLYGGSPDTCRTSYYLLDEFFATSLSTVPFWRASAHVARAALALCARIGGSAPELIAQARHSIEQAETLGLQCFQSDLHMLRAALAVAEGDLPRGIASLDAVIARPPQKSKPTLVALFAQRAKTQLQNPADAAQRIATIDRTLLARGIANPRRFARMFASPIQL